MISSARVKSAQGVVHMYQQASSPIDRTPGTPGSYIKRLLLIDQFPQSTISRQLPRHLCNIHMVLAPLCGLFSNTPNLNVLWHYINAGVKWCPWTRVFSSHQGKWDSASRSGKYCNLRTLLYPCNQWFIISGLHYIECMKTLPKKDDNCWNCHVIGKEFIQRRSISSSNTVQHQTRMQE